MVRLAVADENVPVVALVRVRVLVGLSIVLWFWLCWLGLTRQQVCGYGRRQLVDFVHLGEGIPYDGTTPIAVVIGHDFDARREAVVRGLPRVDQPSLASFTRRPLVGLGGFSRAC